MSVTADLTPLPPPPPPPQALIDSRRSCTAEQRLKLGGCCVRVWVETMAAGKHGNVVGESQSVLMKHDPIISAPVGISR
jgi:hypothetical protein